MSKQKYYVTRKQAKAIKFDGNYQAIQVNGSLYKPLSNGEVMSVMPLTSINKALRGGSNFYVSKKLQARLTKEKISIENFRNVVRSLKVNLSTKRNLEIMALASSGKRLDVKQANYAAGRIKRTINQAQSNAQTVYSTSGLEAYGGTKMNQFYFDIAKGTVTIVNPWGKTYAYSISENKGFDALLRMSGINRDKGIKIIDSNNEDDDPEEF